MATDRCTLCEKIEIVLNELEKELNTLLPAWTIFDGTDETQEDIDREIEINRLKFLVTKFRNIHWDIVSYNNPHINCMSEGESEKSESFHNEKLGLTCRHCGVSVSPMKDNNTECFLCESDTHSEHEEWLLDMEEGESK